MPGIAWPRCHLLIKPTCANQGAECKRRSALMIDTWIAAPLCRRRWHGTSSLCCVPKEIVKAEKLLLTFSLSQIARILVCRTVCQGKGSEACITCFTWKVDVPNTYMKLGLAEIGSSWWEIWGGKDRKHHHLLKEKMPWCHPVCEENPCNLG